ncbi:hypothetical protein [Fusibacter tunisiensis]|jgi:hypothetical protein|uniref:Type 4 fimbrial biogenesis protein PilX N-terminal domain-containing protein n=1 Tax=Fusibacter tunisiensis TaxID=1008308 RepID=A0ABS2MQA0_9FIRM|nr:hypothetical protein [Fusibacter tunisiensis]MBM7561592.1 hypothetical protein [Fusibacter tunisiensis]
MNSILNIKSESGSASVLVVMVALMLSVFGILGLVTANANYKMAFKNAESVQHFYAMESEANRIYRDLEQMHTQIDLESMPNFLTEIEPGIFSYSVTRENDRVFEVGLDADLHILFWREAARTFLYDESLDFGNPGGF